MRGAEIAQEAIDLLAVNRVLAVNRGQDVERHRVAAEHVDPLHHLVKGRPPCPVAAVTVVDRTRPIDADADQELLPGEEGAPGVVEQHAVGLEGIFDPHARWAMLFLQGYRPLEEVDAEHGWLAALPGKDDLVLAGLHLCRDKVAHIALQHRIGHAEALLVRIEFILLQIVAIVAGDVAARPNGLGHHQEGMRRRHGCMMPESANGSSAIVPRLNGGGPTPPDACGD